MPNTSSTARESGSTFVAQVHQSLYKAGLDARSPYPAFALSSLFAVCTPFSFGSGSSQAILSQAKAASASSSNNAGPQLIKNLTRSAASVSARSMPPFWQLVGFSAVFAGGGYMIQQGDPINGSGTITAWSLLYLFFNTRSAFRHPISAVLGASTLTLGTAVHGSFYFDRQGWQERCQA